MVPRQVLHIETNLGLRPSGVERLGEVLLDLGLAGRVGATVAGILRAPAFDVRRDPALGARNVPAVAALATERNLAELRSPGADCRAARDPRIPFRATFLARRTSRDPRRRTSAARKARRWPRASAARMCLGKARPSSHQSPSSIPSIRVPGACRGQVASASAMSPRRLRPSGFSFRRPPARRSMQIAAGGRPPGARSFVDPAVSS